MYEVVAKNDQSQVSTGLAYINGKKLYAQMLTGRTSGDEIIGIVYPLTTKCSCKSKKIIKLVKNKAARLMSALCQTP